MRRLIPVLALLTGCASTAPSVAPTAPIVKPAAEVATARPLVSADAPERVSIRFKATPLPDALKTLGDKVGWNIVLEPGVTTRVNLVLRDVPWRIALDLVLKRSKCEARARGERTLYVHQPPRVTIQ